MNPFRSLRDYEGWIYGLPERFSSISYSTLELLIEGYGYEVWRGSEKLYWYDSQPHPADASLASTDPHHKHIPPDIKHHRVPAPGLSFNRPNLPFLIEEIESGLPPRRSPYRLSAGAAPRKALDFIGVGCAMRGLDIGIYTGEVHQGG